MAIHLEKKTTVQIHNNDALHLFPYYARIGYSTGSLGWNCDVFDLPGLQIRRGYRASGKTIPSELYEDLDAAAKDVPYEECYGLRLEFRDRVFRYLKERDKVYQSIVK